MTPKKTKISLLIVFFLALHTVSNALAQDFDTLIAESPPNLTEKKKYNALMKLPPDGRRGKAMADATEDDKFYEWLEANPELKKNFSVIFAQSLDEGLNLNRKSELKKLMGNTGLSYTIDKDGDATMILNFTDSGRKQQIWIGWQLTKVGNYSLRQVYSYAYVGKIPPDVSAMSAALSDNAEMDTSRWSAVQTKKSGNYVFVLTALVPESADSATLASIIRGVATRADNFEKTHFEAIEKTKAEQGVGGQPATPPRVGD